MQFMNSLNNKIGYIFIIISKMIQGFKMIFSLIIIYTCTCLEPIPIQEQLIGLSLAGKWKRYTGQIFSFPNPSQDDQQDDKKKKEQQEDQDKDKKKQKKPAFFDKGEGTAEGQFYEINNSGPTQSSKLQYIFFRMYENKYITDRIIEFRIHLNNQEKGLKYIEKSRSWETQKFYTSVRLYQNHTLLVTFDIQIKLRLLNEVNQQKKTHSTKVQIYSDSINVGLTLNKVHLSSKYFIILTAINAIQILLMVVFSHESRNMLFGISHWLIIHITFTLMYQAFQLALISQSKFDTNFSYFLINTLLSIVLMFLILRKYQKVFQKFRNREMLAIMLTLFVIYLYLIAKYSLVPIFWVFESMIFLWQIIYSVIVGGVIGLNLPFIIVIVLTRVPIIAILNNDDNIMKIQPNPVVVKLIVFVMFLHLLIILTQKKFGTRWFVPNSIIPDYHNYIRKDFYEGRYAQQDCPICLNKLRERPQAIAEQQDPSKQPQSDEKQEVSLTKLQSDSQAKIQYAFTPCQHAYHKKCLQDWLQTNLVCPLCKRDLPPPSYDSN